MKTKVILLVILFLALILRVVDINNNPPALYGDELTIALDAESILKTGHDQLGDFLPLTFPMGAGRPAGYVYASIPFVVLFGPTPLGVRALSILSGLGVIILLYFIGRKLSSEKLGLAAAFIASVSPWDISLSRGGFEAHFALFLALLGIYLFFKAKETPSLYIWSALCLGLTWHTYPTYKISLIIFLPLLFWYKSGIKNVFEDKGRQYFLIGIFILFILGITSLSQTILGNSEKRFSQINIFSQQDLIQQFEQKINFERSISMLPQEFSKFFHNKPVEYAKVLIENYLQNFSMDFLVIHGDRNPRHNMATMGEAYAVDIVFMLIGLLAFWQRQKKILLFLLIWILIAPLPTAVVDLPHALRSSFMLPPLILLSALGLTKLLDVKNKMLLLAVAMLFLIQLTFFLQKLYFLAPNEYSHFWSYAAKLASEIANDNKNKYDYVVISDRIDSIEFAYPVYSKTDPGAIISQNKQKTKLGNFNFKQFKNVYIGYIPDGETKTFIQNIDGSVLFIGTPSLKTNIDSFETSVDKKYEDSLVIIKKTE